MGGEVVDKAKFEKEKEKKNRRKKDVYFNTSNRTRFSALLPCVTIAARRICE